MTSPALSLVDLDAFDPNAPDTGAERRWCCPLCGGDKPKDSAHRSIAANRSTGQWTCHRCGAGGRLREHWQEKPRPGRRDRGRAQLRQAFSAAPADRGKVTQEMSDGFREQLTGLVKLAGTPGETYLQQRGIPLAVAAAARVRYSPSWLGRPAVVFPARDRQENLVAAEGRYLDDRAPKVRSLGPIGAGVFSAAGAWEAEPLILVESPIDALTLATAGYPAIALLGAGNCPQWLPAACAFRSVLIGFDRDEAGDKGAERLAARLRPLGAKVERLRPSWFSDWNELAPRLTEGLAAALRLCLGTEEPEVLSRQTAVPAWNQERAFDWLRAACHDLGQRVPAGTLTWCDAFAPDLTAALDAADIDLGEAYGAADPEAFSLALVAFAAATKDLAAAASL